MRAMHLLVVLGFDGRPEPVTVAPLSHQDEKRALVPARKAELSIRREVRHIQPSLKQTKRGEV